MPKAAHSNTTPPSSPPTPNAAPISITALGEMAAADRRLYYSLPDGKFGQLLLEREDAMRTIIASRPAVTLSDAVHQLAAAFAAADTLYACDLAASETSVMEGRARDVYRVILSVLPVVAEAAGLTFDELGLDHVADFRANHFTAPEAVR